MSKFSLPQNNKEIDAKTDGPTKTKKYFCIYCKQLFCKLVPHLQLAHRSESSVLEFSKLPKGNGFKLQK